MNDQAIIAELLEAMEELLPHFNDEGLHKMRPDLPLGHQAMAVTKARAAIARARGAAQ